jgi:hypothetical protein
MSCAACPFPHARHPPNPDSSRLADEVDKLRSQLATAQARAAKAEQRSLELATEMSVVERKAINQVGPRARAVDRTAPPYAPARLSCGRSGLLTVPPPRSLSLAV